MSIDVENGAGKILGYQPVECVYSHVYMEIPKSVFDKIKIYVLLASYC